MENGVLTDSVTYFVEEIKNKHEIDLKSITVDKAVPSKEFLVLLDSVRLRRQVNITGQFCYLKFVKTFVRPVFPIV